MKELVIIKNNNLVCDSLQVAEKFHKRHDNVLKSIEGLLKNEETQKMFVCTNYTEKQNKQLYRMYYMNRDGFSLLAMGFTGEKALEWKLKYIQAFNEMEKQLKEHQSIHWQQTRLENKENRLKETKEIDTFIQYAKENGSHHAGWYYKSLSLLADSVAGIKPNDREQATASQLNILTLVEHIITEEIKAGIAQQRYYKEIYKACKAKIEQFQKVAYL